MRNDAVRGRRAEKIAGAAALFFALSAGLTFAEGRLDAFAADGRERTVQGRLGLKGPQDASTLRSQAEAALREQLFNQMSKLGEERAGAALDFPTPASPPIETPGATLDDGSADIMAAPRSGERPDEARDAEKDLQPVAQPPPAAAPETRPGRAERPKSPSARKAGGRSRSDAKRAEPPTEAENGPESADPKTAQFHEHLDWFSVRAGFSDDRANAERMSGELQSRGFPGAKVVQGDRNLYYVEAGLFLTPHQAAVAQARLSQMGHPASVVER